MFLQLAACTIVENRTEQRYKKKNERGGEQQVPGVHTASATSVILLIDGTIVEIECNTGFLSPSPPSFGRNEIIKRASRAP